MNNEPYSREVFFYETDKMGIVHHSNYLRYFEEARLYYMDKYGANYFDIEATGVIIPVLSGECHYKHSLFYGDTLAVFAKFTDYNGVRFGLAYEVRNKKTGELCCTGTTTHCVTTADLKPLNIKKKYPKLHEKLTKMLAMENL